MLSVSLRRLSSATLDLFERRIHAVKAGVYVQQYACFTLSRAFGKL